MPAVCIGGINTGNAQQVVQQSASPRNKISGIAVVSAIIAAADPETEARRLRELVKSSPPPQLRGDVELEAQEPPVVAMLPAVLASAAAARPLSHNMTNLVVQNFAANVALAVGGSPIMSNYGEEAKDLAKLGGALVINMGTITPESLANYVTAIKAYNEAQQPIVFDPVGYVFVTPFPFPNCI